MELKYYSKLFNEKFTIDRYGRAQFESGVIYEPDEIKQLKKRNETNKTKIKIHLIKKLFK